MGGDCEWFQIIEINGQFSRLLKYSSNYLSCNYRAGDDVMLAPSILL